MSLVKTDRTNLSFRVLCANKKQIRVYFTAVMFYAIDTFPLQQLLAIAAKAQKSILKAQRNVSQRNLTVTSN